MLRIACLLMFLGLPLLAQPPRSFYPWWDSPIAKDLNLTDDQTRQIHDVVREYRLKLIDQRAAVEKAEALLEDAFNDENFDSRRANEAVDHLVAARGEMTRSFSQMSLRLRAVLTTGQYRELLKRRPGMQPGQLMRGFQNRRQQNMGPDGHRGQPMPRQPPEGPPPQPQQ